MSAKVMQVIRTDMELRGRGTGPDDVARRIIQYWSLDGELLAEVDPFPDSAEAYVEQLEERAAGVRLSES